MTRIIGLTGGIGSGKSTVANYIASKGIPVYVADEAAKTLMDSAAVRTKIEALFPENILAEDGTLDRKKIAGIVFNSPEKLAALNAIVHPEVRKHFAAWLAANAKADFVIKEVAILFETGGHLNCDQVILITAPQEIRLQRAMLRDHSDRERILKRMQYQLPEAEKIQKSDFVVHNRDLKQTFLEVDQILKILSNVH